MEFTPGMSVACFGGFLLFITLLWVFLRMVANIDLFEEIKRALGKGRVKELTEQEKMDNNIVELDGAKQIYIKKITSNGSEFKDRMTHFVVRRDKWVALNENEKILEGPEKGFVLRGNALLQALTGNPNIELEYVDNDTYEALNNEIGMLKVENANLRFSLQGRVDSVKQQILDEHEFRKEATKARHGGSLPQPQQGGGVGFGSRWMPRASWGVPSEESEGD